MKKLLTASLVFSLLLVASHFPVSAQDKDERGDLIFVVSDKISPAHWTEYEGFLKEFKKLADETGAPSYTVSQNMEGFNYFMNIGKDMVGMDEMNKMWEDWTGSDKSKELGKKFQHMVTYQQTSIWRHAPNHSYMPENYDDTAERTYSRVSWNWLLSGKGEEADAVISEYKQLWADSGITYAVNAYWNVMGQELPLVVFVENFTDRADYMASEKQVQEKVDKARLEEVRKKWMAVVRKMDQTESWGRPDLAHVNEVN